MMQNQTLITLNNWAEHTLNKSVEKKNNSRDIQLIIIKQKC